MRSGRTGFAGLRCARQRVQRQGQLGADRHRRCGQGHRPHDRRRGAIPARDGASVTRRKNMATDKDRTQPRSEKRQDAALLSDILPLPEAKFTGRIGSSYADSKPDIISLPTAPPGAPNVLLVLLDDVGFGQTSTFGGPVNTPTWSSAWRELATTLDGRCRTRAAVTDLLRQAERSCECTHHRGWR